MSEYILDVRGLAQWASLTGNEYGIIAAAVREGRIIIFARVWREFSEIYPDEAANLADAAAPRTRITNADRLAAAALADHVDASFGPYDDGSDWIVAAKAVGGNLTVVTDGPVQSEFYRRLDGCSALSMGELLDRL